MLSACGDCSTPVADINTALGTVTAQGCEATFSFDSTNNNRQIALGSLYQLGANTARKQSS
jgi:hypothetical protein